jgi:hypothetical protein
MLLLKLTKCLMLVAAGPVLGVITASIVLLLLAVALLPGGVEILVIELARAKRGLSKLQSIRRRKSSPLNIHSTHGHIAK